jgi:hypothetical protein
MTVMPLLALLVLLAQEGMPPVSPVMPTDDAPSALACTFSMVLHGVSCAYEAGSAPADRRNNSEAAVRAGGRECAKAIHRLFDNDRVMTGRMAVGKLPEADPFLEPGKDFLFLARFDGMRPSVDDDSVPIAMVTILKYFTPNALLLQ